MAIGLVKTVQMETTHSVATKDPIKVSIHDDAELSEELAEHVIEEEYYIDHLHYLVLLADSLPLGWPP